MQRVAEANIWPAYLECLLHCGLHSAVSGQIKCSQMGSEMAKRLLKDVWERGHPHVEAGCVVSHRGLEFLIAGCMLPTSKLWSLQWEAYAQW
jgi:hypothetical protein